jgi:DNA repair protein RecO (recombination protein O)
MKQPREQRDDQSAFVPHTYPCETSVIVEALPAAYGRGGGGRARRLIRAARGAPAFQPLGLSWSGAGELKTLVKADWRGGLPRVGGSALLCGFYLNELLLKLLPREDPHPQLFRDYEAALVELAGGAEQAPVLRRFELRLLAELGYALPLTHEADTGTAGSILRSGTITQFDRGPRLRIAEPDSGIRSARRDALALAQQDFSAPDAAAEAKRLMREVLDHYLEQRTIVSRRVVRAICRPLKNRRRRHAVIELGVNIDHVATLRQARRTYEPDPVWAAVEAHLGGANGSRCICARTGAISRIRTCAPARARAYQAQPEMAATDEMVASRALKPEMAMLVPEGRRR